MNFKSNLILLVLCIGIFLAFDQQACYGSVRQRQQKVTEEYDKIKSMPEASRDIQKEILKKTFEPVRQPAGRTSPTFIKIRDTTNRLLETEQIRPEEIEALRMDLSEAIENTSSESERAEYEKMGEQLDIVQSIGALQEKKRKLEDIAERSQNNFEQLSGQFDFSLFGNLVLILGLITKLGNITNWKLDRELKRLEIQEKKVKLEKLGVNN
ncbi:MAG: hypothetical protein FVQ84_19715 [Planctomycetes bacterium]|nr:hypothetical protein [Planctomycetota bacterium]